MQTRNHLVYGNLWDEWERNAGKRCLLQGSLLSTKGHSVLLQARAFYINLMQAATAAKEETHSAVLGWTSRLFRAVGAWQFILSISDSSSPLKSWQSLLLQADTGLLQRKALTNPIDSSSVFRSGFFGVSVWGGRLMFFVLFLKESEVQRVLG